MAGMRVVVVGSGVAGASTAFALARRGASVTIVDADAPGRATAAGAGILQPWSSRSTGEFYELYAAGAAYYPELLSQLATVDVTDIGYKRTGAMVVNADASVLDGVEQRLASRAATAPEMGEVRRIGAATSRELFPPLAEGLPAVHISGGARVDGRRLQSGLLSGAVRYGARLIEDSARLEAVGGEASGAAGTGAGLGPAGAWRVVTGSGEELAADAIVVAAGAWTNQVLEPTGARVGVAPQRGQITHLRLPSVDTSAWPVLEPVASHYLLAFDDSRVVIGATREAGSGFDVRVTAAGQLEVLRNALSIAPGLADATLIETRVGLRPYPDGALPSVGALSGFGSVDGSSTALYVNAGFGAAGLTMGPHVGDRLAARILAEG